MVEWNQKMKCLLWHIVVMCYGALMEMSVQHKVPNIWITASRYQLCCNVYLINDPKCNLPGRYTNDSAQLSWLCSTAGLTSTAPCSGGRRKIHLINSTSQGMETGFATQNEERESKWWGLRLEERRRQQQVWSSPAVVVFPRELVVPSRSDSVKAQGSRIDTPVFRS